MVAPPAWDEPAQTPGFDEVTVVLRGIVLVEHDAGVLEVAAGQAVITRAGERVRYSTGARGRRVRRRVPAGVRAGARPPRRLRSDTARPRPGETDRPSTVTLGA